MDVVHRLQAGGHAHRRPPDAVKTDDLLADQVIRVRPPGGHLVVVAAVANRREVVDQGVVPDVEDVALVPGHRHAPGDRGAGDGDVPQPALDEGVRLVALRLGRDESRVGVVELEEALFEGAQAKEPVLLFHLGESAVVDGTVALVARLQGVVVLAAHAVETLVDVLVDVAVLVDHARETSAPSS